MIRADCHICGGRYALTKGGKLWTHMRSMGGGHSGNPFVVERCPGSGNEPSGFSRNPLRITTKRGSAPPSKG